MSEFNQQQLAEYFVFHITKSSIGIDARIKRASDSIPKLISKGWTIPELKNALDQFSNTYPDIVRNVYHIDEIVGKMDPPNNLLEPDVFYYHNSLREVSPPPRLVKDSNGKIIRQEEPFYLEMKSSFTMKELLRHWYQQMEIRPHDDMIRRDEGGFKKILSNYTIDEILFAIDVAKTQRKEKQLRLLRNVFDLEKYIDEAREFIKEKKNTHKMSGINRVIRRESNSSYDRANYPYS